MKIFDTLKKSFGFVGQSLATVKTTDYVSLEDSARVAAAIIASAVGAGSTIVVQWKEATDSNGTGAQNVGDPETITIDGEETAKLAVSAELQSDQLSAGFTHVAATVVEAGSPTPGFTASCVLIRGGNRFNP